MMVSSPKNDPDSKGEVTKMDSDKSPPKSQDSSAENTEQAPEVSTSTTDDVVCQTKPSEDVALILSAEEEAELCVNANEELVKEEPKPANLEKPKRSRKQASKSVWVSNISRSTKAADLKKLFSENFKVESAKIVTNGKSFFGYISLETVEMAQKSVKALNGFNLAGRIIAVSVMRPDLKAGRTSTGEPNKKTRGKPKETDVNEVQKTTDNKQEEKSEDSNKTAKDSKEEAAEKPQDNQASKTNSEDKVKKHQHQETKADRRDRIIENLKKELNTVNSELRITKRRLRDANNRVEMERSRKTELIKNVSRLESQLKQERRRLNQEREQSEKQKKLDEIRCESDRSILNKELNECKKLREYLQMKVEEMRRHRSRSPMSRSPVRRAGLSGRSLPDRGHGGMDKMQRSRGIHISPLKQRGYEASQDRQCTPPPAPKLNKRSSPSRSHERSSPYKSAKKARLDYPVNSYPSNSGGGNRPPLSHYQPMNSLGAPPRGPVWDSSYKMAYKYSPNPAQNAFPMNQGEVMHPRPLEYSEYHKRMPGGPRKY